MLWFVLYLALLFLHCAASWKWIPREGIHAYQASPKPWDYWVAGMLYYSIPLTGLFQAHLSPNDMGILWRLSGVILYLLGSAIWIAARRVNPHFVPVTATPPIIITTGIYRFIHHPGYIGMAATAWGVMQVFSSAWAMVPMCLYWVALFRRAVEEDKLLRRA